MNKKNVVAVVMGILLIIGVVFVLYWYTPQGQTPIVTSGDITANLAWQMITNGSFPSLTVVDVRTPDEYNIMHIQGAINIPYYNTTDFPTRLSPLAGKEDKEIIVYCRLGIRSSNAWLYLNSTGNYHRIYNLLGGITAWRAMNYTVWNAP
jgi:rhodanese-related sulfurtransferase